MPLSLPASLFLLTHLTRQEAGGGVVLRMANAHTLIRG